MHSGDGGKRAIVGNAASECRGNCRAFRPTGKGVNGDQTDKRLNGIGKQN